MLTTHPINLNLNPKVCLIRTTNPINFNIKEASTPPSLLLLQEVILLKEVISSQGTHPEAILLKVVINSQVEQATLPTPLLRQEDILLHLIIVDTHPREDILHLLFK